MRGAGRVHDRADSGGAARYAHEIESVNYVSVIFPRQEVMATVMLELHSSLMRNFSTR